MKRTRLAWWIVFFIGAFYFFVPLIATFVYSLGNPIGRPGRLTGTRELAVPGTPYVVRCRVRKGTAWN